LGNGFDAFSSRGGLGIYSSATASISGLESMWVGGSSNAPTKELFQTIKNAGFTAIRIPVTWFKVAPAPEHIIREDWLKRVREVAKWAYDLDMHVIINTHHEENHKTHADVVSIGLTDAEIEESIRVFTKWWEQIAEEFKDFGDKLMFASLNEPRGRQGEWTGGNAETRANLNRLNQAFVNTVRASGGNNANRFLVVPTHGATGTTRAFDGFEIPKDTAKDKIILEVHTYSPFDWAHDGKGSYQNSDRIRSDLHVVSRNAERLGVPVILGEWGSVTKPGNLDQRIQHANDYISIAREFGMASFWWDNNSVNETEQGFALFNRRTREIHFPRIIDAIMRAHNK